MCISKIETELTNEKILIIVEAIPDCITIIDKDINCLFHNPSFLAMVKGKSFLDFLSENRYYRRYYDSGFSNEIICDIKDSFDRELGVEINFGIIQKNQEFIE